MDKVIIIRSFPLNKFCDSFFILEKIKRRNSVIFDLFKMEMVIENNINNGLFINVVPIE